MKKILIFNFLLLLIFSGINSDAQSYFEGEIIYDIEYLSIPDDMKEIQAYLPNQMILLSKGTKYKTINKIPNRTDQINIMNNFDGSGFLLIDFLGHKIALANDVQEVHKANALYFQSELENYTEEKEIMGLNCKKARIISEGDTTDAYFFQKVLSPEFKYVKLKGLPLEYTTNQDGLLMNVKAVKFKERTVSESEFLIPSDYKKMSKDQLEDLFKL